MDLRYERICHQPPLRMPLLHSHEHAAHVENIRSAPDAWELVLIGEGAVAHNTFNRKLASGIAAELLTVYSNCSLAAGGHPWSRDF